MIDIGERKIRQDALEQISSILTKHLQDGHSLSLWRLPQSSKKNLIISTTGSIPIDEVPLEELESGFVFAPFRNDHPILYLKADIVYTIEEGEVKESVSDGSATEQPEEPQLKKMAIPFFEKKSRHVDTDKEHYIQLVQKSIVQISEQRAEKLVPSRSRKIRLPQGFNLLQAFDKLCTLYPNAFVSLVSTPETGTWMGASPELLVSVDNKMLFRTAAIAGTQPLLPGADIRTIAWTQKEIEEQALVGRYIINCFKKIRLREYEEHGPRTWQAGNLLHLKTDFEVDMNATNFPQLGSVMLKLLHPTSAVCGMPRELSINFLNENEKLDRQYYSGYLGPVNFGNESNIFVNLRCMQWCNQEAILFAGAGVTIDSVPEKEWEETEMKMNTLLRVLTP